MYNVKILSSDSAFEIIGYSEPIYQSSVDSDFRPSETGEERDSFDCYIDGLYSDPDFCEPVSDIDVSSFPVPDDDGWISDPDFIDAVDDMFQEHARSVSSSVARTRSKLSSLILHNCSSFKYFCTFTFSPDIVDRFSYSDCASHFSAFLHNLSRCLPGLKYVAVPERHKNGAFHFHALFSSDIEVFLRPAKVKSRVPLFNLSYYKLGFSSVSRIISPMRASSYVMKYVTKDCLNFVSRKRYWASRNLSSPKVALLLLPSPRAVSDFVMGCPFSSYSSSKTFRIPGYKDFTVFRSILSPENGYNLLSYLSTFKKSNLIKEVYYEVCRC